MRFKELTEQQLLALAISLEEEDGGIYRDFAETFRADYAASVGCHPVFSGSGFPEARTDCANLSR